MVHHLLGFRVVKMNYRRIGHLISEYDSILNLYGQNQYRIYFCINKNLCANKSVLDLIANTHILFTEKICVLIIESMTRWGNLSIFDASKFIQADNVAAEYPKILNETTLNDYKLKVVNSFSESRNTLLFKIFGEIPKWYVCIHTRNNDDHYSDGEIQKYRNAKLANLRGSVEFIKKKGGTVILMGGNSRTEEINFNGFYDYATSEFKSELNDIILISGCKFFLGCTSGLFQVATFFNIPCGLANVVPLAVSPFSGKDIFIYKHHYDNLENRFLNFEEVKDLGFESERAAWHLQKRLSLIENSEEEIESLCKKMYKQVILKEEILPTIYGFATLNKSYYGYHSLAKLDPSFIL